jgi:hypothetical protein
MIYRSVPSTLRFFVKGDSMGNKDTRSRLKDKRQREKLRATLTWSAIGAAVLLIIAALIWPSVRPAAGEEVQVMESSNHVPVGADPGPYNTNPPTSGLHYDAPIQAGFYDETSVEEIGPFPEGYLVHNLEHGYVVFWYNCTLLDSDACTSMKDQLREVLSDARNIKVIAFPWDSLDVPVVATSWSRMQEFEDFDPQLALRFVRSNRNRAPEPQAQ